MANDSSKDKSLKKLHEFTSERGMATIGPFRSVVFSYRFAGEGLKRIVCSLLGSSR